jgi:hypothetical protein
MIAINPTADEVHLREAREKMDAVIRVYKEEDDKVLALIVLRDMWASAKDSLMQAAAARKVAIDFIDASPNLPIKRRVKEMARCAADNELLAMAAEHRFWSERFLGVLLPPEGDAS